MVKEYIVTETEWWDRVAMAVDMLEKSINVQRKKLIVAGQTVEWVGNHFKEFVAAFQGLTEASASSSVDVTAFMYDGIESSEILRRLNQMPDETPRDLLILPFSIYCPELKSFVSINDFSVSLEEHLDKMKGMKI